MRPLWSGTLSFGLVNVPVEVFPANRGSSSSLRLLSPDGTPLSRRYTCPTEGEDVDADELVRGYELESGEYVVVTDEELEALAPEKSREIDLRRFVDDDAVPPRFFERGYWLAPAGDTTKAYRLLAEVMERGGRTGIATFVMRGKEYLVAVRADGGILRAETLRFEDELRSPEDVGLPDPEEPDAKRVSKLGKAIRKLEGSFDPDDLRDAYADELEALAERKKRKGKDVHEVEEAEPQDADQDAKVVVLDLVASIRKSLSEKADGGDGRGTPLASGRGKDGRKSTRRATGDEMPKAWSKKDERQYEHVKDSAQDRGASKSRAKEIAARTVNKHRREEGRTPNKTTQGTGKPGKSLDDRTKDELYNMAKDLDVDGRSKMTKKELVSAIRKKR